MLLCQQDNLLFLEKKMNGINSLGEGVAKIQHPN